MAISLVHAEVLINCVKVWKSVMVPRDVYSYIMGRAEVTISCIKI